MSHTRRDLIAAALILLVTAVFWTQQDFTTETDVIFPRFVLAVLTALGVAIAATALVRARKGGRQDAQAAGGNPPPEAGQAETDRSSEPPAAATAEATESDGPEPAPEPGVAVATADPADGPAEEPAAEPAPEQEGPRPRWILPAAIVLLLSWSVAFGLFGITLSGVVAFVAASVLIRRGFGPPRRLLLDIGVAAVVALFCWAVFTRVLYVPLPVSVILGV
ncbi:hypothetical protein GCM10027570_00610 [Streptomonospora sediminis]